MAYEEILNAKKVADNGLLSKIQIGGKVYEIKDLIAREEVIKLWAAENALSANVGDVSEFGENTNLVAVIKNIQANAYDDTAIRGLITALEGEVAKKADAEQVAKDIAAAVAAEAEIARAAEKANADEIARVDAALKLAIDDEDGKGLNSIKDLATWIEEHGEDAAEMSAAITKNTEDIAAMDTAYKAADAGLAGRIETLEGKFTGDESVDALIEAAKEAAIAAAAKDASDKDAVVTEAYKAADKAITDNLGALSAKDNASGTVAGQTISGVKATGTSTGSITVELAQSEHDMSSTGKYTPVGTVSGTVTPSGSVSVTVSNSAADATLTKGDYTPAGTVSVALSGDSFNKITGVGTQASFQEGAFTPATLSYDAVEKSVAKEGLVGSVEDECLTFTAAGLEAISASKVTAFNGGSKASDTFVANSLPTMEAHQVGVASAAFSGTLAEDLVVTNVSYAKANAEAAATFTGNVNDIAATFAGTEGDISVAGKCHDYAVKTAAFNGAAIELAVGDITVAAKDVTVQ